MSDWRTALSAIASDVEGHFDSLKQNLIERLHPDYPLQIVPYISYGTAERVYVKGRVLADKGITSAEENDAVWENLLNMYRRFKSRETPYAKVEVSFAGVQQAMTADEEGYFEGWLELPAPLPADRIWYEAHFTLLEVPDEETLTGQTTATGKVMIPPENAEFGVISDLDDTVIQTNVLNYVKMARNVFLHNSHTRLPFEGVAAFYRALQRGTTNSWNPVFYLSKSPWNIYDLLVDFLTVRKIPLGPLMLTDLGFTDGQLLFPNSHEYKFNHIQTLFDTYPDLPFILIGDSGQKDPEIYLKAAQENPGRVLAIYIRNVTDPVRGEEISAMSAKAHAVGAELLLMDDTAAASNHALANAFIEANTMPEIEAERAEDKKEPLPVEKLIDPTAKA